jgi:hypothetical protein
MKTLEIMCINHVIAERDLRQAPQEKCYYCDGYNYDCTIYKPQKSTQIPVRRGIYSKMEYR